jgi:hypothetical protein
MEDSCRHLLIGGDDIEGTHYYLCEKGYEDYCEEPESDYYNSEDWRRY